MINCKSSGRALVIGAPTPITIREALQDVIRLAGEKDEVMSCMFKISDESFQGLPVDISGIMKKLMNMITGQIKLTNMLQCLQCGE